VVGGWRPGSLRTAFAVMLLLGCEPKVPIVDIGAQFTLAEATWFEAEETLFIFYRVDAIQGLSEFSQVELSYLTDNIDQPFEPLANFTAIHDHRPVTCGVHTLCGSYSVRIADPPRQVQLQLRYHRDGALTLAAPLSFQVVGTGPPHTNRSAIPYGVFNGDNSQVQWRLRHQFPTIRNEDAEALGLHRQLDVEEARYGTLSPNQAFELLSNPYGYALTEGCPPNFIPLNVDPLQTTDRAIFDPNVMPLGASASAHVCATATVIDARGPFVSSLLAQKNPETETAFSALQSPVTVNTPLRFMLETCNDIVSERHRLMQLQRLQMDESDVICVDDFATIGFVDRMARLFEDTINEVRVDNNDMVLVIGLNRADRNGVVAARLEEALARVLGEENDKSSPRLSGAFVYDSAPYAIQFELVSRLALWCPSNFGGGDLDVINDASQRSCAVQANQELELGPIRITTLPILPTRRQYETFVDRYSENQAGTMDAITFRAPSRTPLSTNLFLEGFGVLTFLNNEAITAVPTDAFSICPATDGFSGVIAFQSEEIPPQPLDSLALVHLQFPQSRYQLGIIWDSPFHLRLDYVSSLAGAATAQGFTVPFGLNSPATVALGYPLWEVDSIDLSDVLLRCTRFCTHPTFDSAGVYNVLTLFNTSYANACYRPVFPRPTDGGSPRDP
jgi:hypothetical protein